MTSQESSTTIVTSEDPFGPGDPLEVARLVRRALAGAGRKALEVVELVVVADATVAPEPLSRFARRALGPHGGSVRVTSIVSRSRDHETRQAVAMRSIGGRATPGDGLVVMLVLGPRGIATAACLG